VDRVSFGNEREDLKGAIGGRSPGGSPTDPKDDRNRTHRYLCLHVSMFLPRYRICDRDLWGIGWLRGATRASHRHRRRISRMEFVNAEGLRLDGRRAKELRRLRCELGTLAHADGSCVLEMGNTKVLSAVFGPREVELKSQVEHDRAVVKVEFSMSNFSTGDRRKRSKTDRMAKETSLVLQQTIESAILVELLPRTQIDIYVQVLQADGGAKPACINAAAMALMDAGVPLRDIIAACEVGFLDNTPILDKNLQELQASGPDVLVAYLPKMEEVVTVLMEGKVALEVFNELRRLGCQGCEAIARFMREQVIEHTRKMALIRGVVKT